MPNGDSGGFGFGLGDLLGGLLGVLSDIINAIISFLQQLVSALVAALNFLLAGEENIFGFSFSSISEVWQGLKKLADAIFRNVVLAAITKLWHLYEKLAAWAKKLKAWLDRLHAIMRKYQMLYFRKIIQIIQRARKILAIFRFFHLKFAQKLDNYLAKIEGKITHYLLLVAQKENEVIAWVNLLVDPRGALRKFSFLAGMIAALDVTWSGIFGTAFHFFPLQAGGTQPTTKLSVTLGQTASDVKAGAGDGGAIASAWPTMQKNLSIESGGA